MVGELMRVLFLEFPIKIIITYTFFFISDACEPIREEVNNLYTVYYSEEPVSGRYAPGVTAHIYCNPDTILVVGDGGPVCENGSWLPEIPLCLHRDLVDGEKRSII